MCFLLRTAVRRVHGRRSVLVIVDGRLRAVIVTLCCHVHDDVQGHGSLYISVERLQVKSRRSCRSRSSQGERLSTPSQSTDQVDTARLPGSCQAKPRSRSGAGETRQPSLTQFTTASRRYRYTKSSVVSRINSRHYFSFCCKCLL